MGISSSLRDIVRPPDQPRWLAVAFTPALAGHGVAAFGLYWDIAWHIDAGRDEQLFTTPHTLILAGLALLLLSACAGMFVAARDGIRLPRGLIAAAFSSAVAVLGFPLDELWHSARGLDVTLWSPTHVMMVGGGALSILPLWFAVGEAGVRPADGRGPWLMHTLAAMTLLGGLSSFQGEFDFGVPQFQLLYHPVLVLLSGALALIAARAVLGRGGAVAVAAAFLVFRGALTLFVAAGAGLTAPRVALYLGLALAVEAAALLRPPSRGLVPYALLSAAAVGTVGLATEWAWAAALARHPWNAGLVTEAVLVGLVASFGGALLAAGIAAAFRAGTTAPHPALLALGGLLALLALALPLPRTETLSPQAAVSYEHATGPGSEGEARVRVVIGPPDAPYAARWWEVLAYQGGGMRIAPLVAGQGSGVYETAGTVPVEGDWKVALRLHKGTDMLGAMLRRPADAEAGEDEIELREGFVTLDLEELSGEPAGDTPGWLAPFVLTAVALLWLGWAALTVRGGRAARDALRAHGRVRARAAS